MISARKQKAEWCPREWMGTALDRDVRESKSEKGNEQVIGEETERLKPSK